MNESTLFQGAVVFVIGNVDPKVSNFDSPLCILVCILISRKFKV